MKTCSVKGCFSVEDEERRFFHFPWREQKARFQQWVDFCHDKSLAHIKGRPQRYVCDLHFEREDLFDGDRLQRTAVPSLHGPLPVSEEILEPLATVEVQPAETPDTYIPSAPTHQFTISSTPGTSTPFSLPSDISNESYPVPSTSCVFSTSTPIPKCKKRLPFSTPSPDQTLAKPSSYSGIQYEHSYQSNSLTLKDISLTRNSQLDTPRKRYLYKYAKKKENELTKLTRKYRKIKVQMHKLCDPKNSTVAAVESLSKHMSAATLLFLSSQLRCSHKKPRARRWTVEEKTLALSFYKRSPKAYTLMCNVFTLPSKKTLKRLVNKLPFTSGINDQMFTTLSQQVEQLNKRDRVCALVFDEISIREHLQYNCSTDRIDGFEDLGHKGRSRRIANHALVFMVRGLFRMWKQPVAYYFSHSSMRSDILAELIFFILEACCKAGLYVVATVCDMGATNVKALRIMGSTKPENPYFLYNNKPIFTILDPPHLLKCTRNLLLKYTVKCHVKTESLDFDGEAKWNNIRRAYEWDRGAADFGGQKVKVRLAAQLLSHRVTACIYTAVACGILESSAIATAAFVKQCDNLFDSFNGCIQDRSGKPLRSPLSQNSQHMAFWQQALEFVDLWRFQRPGRPLFRPPSQDGWLTSINAIMQLWMSVRKDFGREVSFLSVRCLNQDALENVFGSVRANCGSNHNPTVPQFVDALKTCIINGLAFRELRNSNCLDDDADLLSNLQTFLGSDVVTDKGSAFTPYPTDTSYVTCDVEPDIPSNMNLMSTAYVSGFTARKLLGNSTCDDCRAGLCTEQSDELFLMGIRFREYTEGIDRLTYPSEYLVTCVAQCANLVDEILDEKGHLDGLAEVIMSTIKQRVSFKWLRDCCAVHYDVNVKKFINTIFKICVPWWCKRKNN